MTTHIYFTDAHTGPGQDNTRALWLANLIHDVKPDVVVNGGDQADLYSLNSYDKGKGSFRMASYEADIKASREFDDLLFSFLKKKKKKRPRFVFTKGNHEYRLDRLLNQEPHLSGGTYGISPKNLGLEDNYEVVEYEGNFPGQITIDGITYSHYFPSGGYGNPISGENHARSLLSKNHCSCSCGHSHKVDWSVQRSTAGKTSMGLVGGTFQEEPSSGWAGVVANGWWSGLVIKRNVEDGMYDPEFVSIKRLKQEYG